MSDLTLHSRVRLNPDGSVDHSPRGICVWCGKPTEVMTETPFRPDLGAVPFHLFCGVFMQDAYRAWKAGRTLDADDVAGMARLANLPRLGDGS